MKSIEWKIYEVIKERSKEDLWTSVGDVAKIFDISERSVRRIINSIRKDDTIQKIIITDYTKGYKLMTSEEEFEYLSRRRNNILRQLKQLYKDIKRFDNNKQMKITFGEYERDFYESILSSEE